VSLLTANGLPETKIMAIEDRSEDARRSPVLSRREFVTTVGTTVLAATTAVSSRSGPAATAGTEQPKPAVSTETAVARFFHTLSDQQRKLIGFPADHPLRSRIANNWAVVRPTIGDMTREQQALCQEIFGGLCSPEGCERFRRQMKDDYGGFENYHVAVFGEPNTERPFEWLLTGRHATLRVDGNGNPGGAFGPIFYGHAAEGHFHAGPKPSRNVWWYQAEQANKIFATLDSTQRTQALVDRAEADSPRSIQIHHRGRGELHPNGPGLAVAELDGQQKPMVQKLLDDLTMPFHPSVAETFRKGLSETGGADRLRLTFYKEGDLGRDGLWDVWKLEGPAFAWYFHGAPHVHVWLNTYSSPRVT
jgi:hypothetical protein